MSTRSCIAHIKDVEAGTFKGRYHHWDGYPEGLGAFLYEAYHKQFNGDIDKMLSRLIDDCKCGGWISVVGCDFSLPDNSKKCDYSLPREEMHYSARSFADEYEKWFDETNSLGAGVEYVYAFDGTTMYILSSYNADGAKMIGMFGMGNPDASWKCIGRVDLNEEEPDWEAITKCQYPEEEEA